jgi:hypothetical protein
MQKSTCWRVGWGGGAQTVPWWASLLVGGANLPLFQPRLLFSWLVNAWLVGGRTIVSYTTLMKYRYVCSAYRYVFSFFKGLWSTPTRLDM